VSDARPRLEVVEGGAGAAPGGKPASSAPAPATDSASGGRSRAVVVAWALAGLLALAVLGFAQQGRRAERLTARVGVLESELAASEAALEAHRSHLSDVRGAVAELQELVARDPAPPAAPAPRPLP
jgi:uncharacterized protein HemX